MAIKLIILGHGRSGTTILWEIRHAQPGPGRFWERYLRAVGLTIGAAGEPCSGAEAMTS